MASCQQYLHSIQESVDGTLGSIRRAELDLHLDQCVACRELRDDLQRIHDAAAALPALDAPDRAWLQIAGRLRQEGRIHDEAPQARPARRAAWLAAAPAAAVNGSGNAAETKSVETLQNEVDTAQQQFEKAIAELEKVAKANQQA